jgi:hypothetical protein
MERRLTAKGHEKFHELSAISALGEGNEWWA